MPSPTTPENFLARVYAKSAMRGKCRIWSGVVNRDGYALMRRGGKLKKVSRMIWEHFKGPIPKGQSVLHHCDNRACVEIGCFFLGTSPDNTADCVTKRRHAFGQRNARAKLSDRNVLEIRRRKAAGESAKNLAKEFDVHCTTIHRAVTQLWRHI